MVEKIRDHMQCEWSAAHGRGLLSHCARMRLYVMAGLLALGPQSALAHGDQPPAPHDLWSSWHLEPVLLLSLAAGAWLYARGIRQLWKRAGIGRGVHCWQAACFAAGLIALFIALVSPLDALGSALFSAHMAQHLMLILIAAPLLVLGAPPIPLLWALPLLWRRRVVVWQRHRVLQPALHMMTQAGVVWIFHIGVLWIWHLPRLYQAAVDNDFVHVLEHSSFLTTALLFWWIVIHPPRQWHASYGYGGAALYIFTMAVPNGLLAALITFAPTPWYPVYSASTMAWNLTPVEDQQLAGLIMWVPPTLLYTIVASILVFVWLSGYASRMESQRVKQPHAQPVIERT